MIVSVRHIATAERRGRGRGVGGRGVRGSGVVFGAGVWDWRRLVRRVASLATIAARVGARIGEAVGGL
eukprot:scaffold41322_cov60-Phaeocystis_antarctica.AAC.5